LGIFFKFGGIPLLIRFSFGDIMILDNRRNTFKSPVMYYIIMDSQFLLSRRGGEKKK